MPGSAAGAIRSLLVIVAGFSFWAFSHMRSHCVSCAAGAAVVTSAVTRPRSVVFMPDKTTATANSLTAGFEVRAPRYGSMLVREERHGCRQTPARDQHERHPRRRSGRAWPGRDGGRRLDLPAGGVVDDVGGSRGRGRTRRGPDCVPAQVEGDRTER